MLKVIHSLAMVSGSVPPLSSVSKTPHKLMLGSGENICPVDITQLCFSTGFQKTLETTSKWVSLGITYSTHHWEGQLPS